MMVMLTARERSCGERFLLSGHYEGECEETVQYDSRHHLYEALGRVAER